MVQMTSSQENFLYDKLLRKIGEDNLEEIKIPNEVLENLKQKNLNQNFEIREYQKRAFQMSIAYFEKYKDNGKGRPEDRELFREMQGLGDYKYKDPEHPRILVNSIPSLSTHAHLPWLAPIVDWEREAKDIFDIKLK